MQRFGFSLAVALTLSGAAATAQGVEGHSRVTLLPGWAEGADSYVAAVQIELGRGWKTYWRSPGMGGIPPQFDWTGSQNIAAVEVLWPTPEVFYTYGMRNIGYTDRVVFPVRMTLADRSADTNVSLRLSYGVCADICIPAEAAMSGALPVAEAANQSVIGAAIADAAVTGSSAGLTSVACRLAPGDAEGDFGLAADLAFAEPLGAVPVTVFEIGDPDLWIEPAETEAAAGQIAAHSNLTYFGEGALGVSREDINISLILPERVIEIQGC
ncbi:MAG: protein-disulfide reductase DsbD domain-containing protein [Pseudomonadota bacterium]